MEKQTSNADTDKAIVQVTSEQVLHHTCQFFHKPEDKILPFASGVFVILGGIHYIFTAAHVTEALSDETPLFLKIHNGYVSVVGTLNETEQKNGVDLGYIRLDERIIPNLLKSYKFLPLEKIRGRHKLLDASNYCVLGFPTKNQTVENDGRIRTGASIYVIAPCKEVVYSHYKFNSETSLFMEMKGKGSDLLTGEKSKIDDRFYGISGCGLWLLLFSFSEGDYTVDYRLIGIMTEFRKSKYYCLIGNKIDILLEGLEKFEGFQYRIRSQETI